MKTKIDVNSKVNKKSFYLFNDTEKVFEMLTDEEAGKLIKHLFSYVNDKESKLNDRLLEVAFEPIRLQLERDKKRYESVCERNRENGLKGGRPRKKRNPNNPVGLLETQNNPKEPKKADTDTDTDTDTDNKEKTNKKEVEFRESIKPFIEKYGKDICNNFFLYWTEPNKSKTKLRYELEKTWDVSRRLANWANRDKTFNTKNSEKDKSNVYPY